MVAMLGGNVQQSLLVLVRAADGRDTFLQQSLKHQSNGSLKPEDESQSKPISTM
jgi:hypothetical protein